MALRQAEAGTTVDEVCRKLGVSQGTFFRWKKRFGSLGVAELRERDQLLQLLVLVAQPSKRKLARVTDQTLGADQGTGELPLRVTGARHCD